MKEYSFRLTKAACYSSYFTMSSVFCVPPLLFVTFKETYDISYTLLGTLVLVNFLTQLGIDLIFTFFSKYFNPKLMIRTMPLLTSLGLAIYAIVPTVAPDLAYLGLLIGTVIFSVSAGLSEVLLSPTIAAIPSDDPKREMSLLHSLYAFGVLATVLFSTLFLKLFDVRNWSYLILVLAALPIISAVLFTISPMPDISDKDSVEGAKMGGRRTLGLALCVGCIFFGSCAETVMSTWISGYVEGALGVDKLVGDVLGVCMFAVLLGLTRIWYAKYGKNIFKMLLIGMIGCSVCYTLVGVVSNMIIAFIACILVGLFSAMLWPGTLIMMEENLPGVGVGAFALMASGGDFGAALAPQLMGVVIDEISATDIAAEIGTRLGLAPDQVGMKAGMLITAIFPIIGTALVIITMRYFKKAKA